MLYNFFNEQRASGASSSKLKGFLEALSFCRFVLSMDELEDVTKKKQKVCRGH